MMVDDFIFKPYPYGGYQCLMTLKTGTLAIRFGSNSLSCDENTYEIRMPNGDVCGYMSADEIWEFIRNQCK